MIRKLRVFVASMALTGLMFVGFTAPVSAAFNLFEDACSVNEDATVCKDNNPGQTQENNRLYGPSGIVSTVITIMSIVVGFAAIIVIIIAGIQYMLSTGDPTKVNNSKNAILYALVGLAIAVIAQTVVIFIINKL